MRHAARQLRSWLIFDVSQKRRPVSSSRKPRTHLPSQKDFDPWGGHLDAQSAWQNFGGLDLDAAYRRFIENPSYYQEDFMFMGPRAFAFYFPVVDRYLREVRNDDPLDLGDCQAWILGEGIRSQIEESGSSMDAELFARIASLVGYVLEHLGRYAHQLKDQKRVRTSWTSVEKVLKRQTKG
jgi:hypothetical protein